MEDMGFAVQSRREFGELSPDHWTATEAVPGGPSEKEGLSASTLRGGKYLFAWSKEQRDHDARRARFQSCSIGPYRARWSSSPVLHICWIQSRQDDG